MKGNRLRSLGLAFLGTLALFLASCQQQAPQARVISVTVTPATAEVEVGGTVALQAQVQVQGNAPTTVTWSSSNTSVATVDSNGVVRGVAEGTAVIRATSTADSNVFGQATVRVVPQARPNVSITAPANGATIGGPFQATVRVSGQGQLASLTYTFAGGNPVSILGSGVAPQQTTYDITRVFNVNVPDNLANGTYTLRVVAQDTQGRQGSAEVQVNLLRRPRIDITLAPVDNNSNLVVLQQNIGGIVQNVPYVRGRVQVGVQVNGFGNTPTRVEIFVGRTEGDTSTRLYDGSPANASVEVDSAPLAQGQVAFFVARVYFQNEVAPGQNNLTQSQIFIPDNLPPQLPDIVEVSKLSPAQTAARGNWVNGTFQLSLENLTSLVDNPQGPGLLPSGVRTIRYFADRTPFDATFHRDILLGEASVSPYRISVDSTATLPDGTYRIFAVAVDQLGNESTGPLSAFILNVDNTPPGLTLTVVDRGTGDVGAGCAGNGNVDVFPASPGVISGCARVAATARDGGVGFDPAPGGQAGSLNWGIGSANLPAAGGPPFFRTGNYTNNNLDLNAVNGPLTFTLQSADLLGNQATLTQTVTVDNNRPQAPNFTSPSANTLLFDAWSQITLGAQATDAQTAVREIRFYLATNAAPGVGITAPVWSYAGGALPGLLQVGTFQGASGAVNVRLPDPTNEAAGAANRSLELIALAVDQGGNVRAASRSVSIRHTAGQNNGVNVLADNVGNNNQRFELTFLAPPSGIPTPAARVADPALGPAAGLVGQSQYILSFVDNDAINAIQDGSLSQLAFYNLRPASDPLVRLFRAPGGNGAAIGFPAYTDNAATNIWELIQSVESAPFRVNWTLEPSLGVQALIFNTFGHSSNNQTGGTTQFIVRAQALACPQGNYSVTANTPLDGLYAIQYWNAAGNVQARAQYVRASGTAGPVNALGNPSGAQPAPDGSFVFDTAAAGDATQATLGLASGSTYTQQLLVTDGTTNRIFTLCPMGSINVVP